MSTSEMLRLRMRRNFGTNVRVVENTSEGVGPSTTARIASLDSPTKSPLKALLTVVLRGHRVRVNACQRP